MREEVRGYEVIDGLRQMELIDDAIFSKIANYLYTSHTVEAGEGE